MALICGNGHYLSGASSCRRCGWTEPAARPTDVYGNPGLGSDPDLPSDGGVPSPPAAPLPVTPTAYPAVVPAPPGALRGRIADLSQTNAPVAGGIGVLRAILALTTLVCVVVKAERLVQLVVDGALRVMLAYLLPVIIVFGLFLLVARFLPVGGCLTALFQIGMLGAVRRVGNGADLQGWRVQVLTADGLAPAQIAVAAPLNGGEEVVVHGPTIGGVKHAWLIMGVSPGTFTRFGRGVVRTLLMVPIVATLCVMLLTL